MKQNIAVSSDEVVELGLLVQTGQTGRRRINASQVR